MRHNQSHRTSIEDSLHEAQTALVRHSYERSDACRNGGDAQLACIAEGESGVFEVDEQTIVAARLCDLDDLRARDDLDAEGRADLAFGGAGEEVVGRDGCGRGAGDD